MSVSNKRPSLVIIPSLNQNNHTPRVLFCLAEAGIKNIFIVSALKNDPIKHSFNLKTFHYVPLKSDKFWVEKILSMIKSMESTVLLPVDYWIPV